MFDLLLSIRPLNLFIILFSQSLFYFLLLKPLANDSLSPLVISDGQFWLIVLLTEFLAGSGYWVNNLFDQRIDQYNQRPNPFSNGVLSLRSGWLVYVLLNLVIIGLALSLIPLSINYLWSALIAGVALFWYSYQLKCVPLAGNIIISCFVGCVPLMVFWGELSRLAYWWQNPHLNNFVLLVLTYSLFAFFSNLLREIIKTIEDFPGDRAQSCQTLAVTWGVTRAAWLALIILTITGLLMFRMLRVLDTLSPQWSVGVIILSALMLGGIGYFLIIKKWRIAQQMVKLLMLLGLMALFLY